MKSETDQIIEWLRTGVQGPARPSREMAAKCIERLRGAAVASEARIYELLTERNHLGLDVQTAASTGRVPEGHQFEPQLKLVACIFDEMKMAQARAAHLLEQLKAVEAMRDAEKDAAGSATTSSRMLPEGWSVEVSGDGAVTITMPDGGVMGLACSGVAAARPCPAAIGPMANYLTQDWFTQNCHSVTLSDRTRQRAPGSATVDAGLLEALCAAVDKLDKLTPLMLAEGQILAVCNAARRLVRGVA